MIKILFICHGNICRSVAAEYIAKNMILQRGLESRVSVFSRAVSYEEIGNDIYPPMKRTLTACGIPFSRHYANIISKKDLEESDLVCYMDESNRRFLIRMFGDNPKFLALPSLVPGLREIEDPWYSGRYELVVEQITSCVDALLNKLIEEKKL